MRAILILLLSVITLSVTAQQRYRVTSSTDFAYDTSTKKYEPVVITEYGYKQGVDRGSNYNNDTVLYDTVRYYRVENGMRRLSGYGKRTYNSKGLLDTQFTYRLNHETPVLYAYDAFLYDAKGKKLSKSVCKLTDTALGNNMIKDNYGFSIVRKDSFTYAKNLLVLKEHYCRMGDCIIKAKMDNRGALVVSERYEYKYRDTFLVSVVSIVGEPDSEKTCIYRLKQFWYNDDGSFSSSATREVIAEDCNTYHTDYNELLDTMSVVYGNRTKQVYHVEYSKAFSSSSDATFFLDDTQYTLDTNGNVTTMVETRKSGKHDRTTMQHIVIDEESVTTNSFEYNAKGKLIRFKSNCKENATATEPDNFVAYDDIDGYVTYTHFGAVKEEFSLQVDNRTGEVLKTKTTYTYEAY